VFANLKFHSHALLLRAERQTLLAANIANADTPQYKARDIDFAAALADAQSTTNARVSVNYRQTEQASGDNNTVDMDRERANFADNSIRYEATLKFINGEIRTLQSAIRGE
jgi:flagellar basal-body rod protein FlgB